ncbi:hypothetical protein CDAR_587191 [Caerostris darwini]|uniref:Uncharacterized protein n=1 Tax=Caerostris darwini TaxID=1538125 RepID=A0AAV4SX11_9ARAC|nr:hypothetical protein CDAR_587191 [Caerostris darwini]
MDRRQRSLRKRNIPSSISVRQQAGPPLAHPPLQKTVSQSSGYQVIMHQTAENLPLDECSPPEICRRKCFKESVHCLVQVM